ncbi:MAG: dehydrogenase [bacterium]|nr:dehydrogenase [bacterium]
MTPNPALLRYAFMRLTRDLDARFESLLLTGRVSKWYSSIGTEATTVPAGLALLPGDVLCTLHRDLGAILTTYLDPARTFPGLGFGVPDGRRPDPVELLERLACQLLGKARGFSGGFERSFHYGYLAPEAGIRHVGMISHLGAMIPVAAGCAFALKHEGSDRVALNFIGDGGTSTGDFHEGLNMAAVWRLPLVLIIENNRYAFSTPAESQYAAERLSDRGRGYGIAAETVDGNDPDLMAKALARAVNRARSGDGPTLIEAVLGRMRGHSEGDDSLKVVPQRELDAYLSEDPVPAYAQRLHLSGFLDFEILEKIEQRCDFLIEAALAAANAAELPDPKTARRPALAPAPEPEPSSIAAASDETVAYVDAIRLALTEEMELDDRVILLGQDIGRFEGAFRVTRGLHERWPRRVLDTPIAESGTIGIAVGAALLGYRVVVEMQFADFVSCGFNQIVNVAAKLFYRWQVPCPIVVRLPSGGGVGAGAFHSQNPEAWFSHVAGLKVVCPASAQDARALLKAAIRDPNPVIFCEHKFLYRRIKERLPGEWEVAPIGSAVVRRPGKDLTLIGYGASTWTCIEAAEQLAAEGAGDVEVIDLRSLVPLDWPTIEASVRRTSRAVVVHEAQRTSGFGAEVVAAISERAFAWLDAPVVRVAYPDLPVPYARNLERELLPSAERVVSAVKEVLAY